MAIAVNNGGSGSNSTASTTVAAAAFATTSPRDILVAVSIAAAGVTVSTVTDTGGNTYSQKSVADNSSNGVRVELWQAINSPTIASNVVTATLSGASLAAIAAQAYSGTAHSTQNTGSAHSAGWFPGDRVVVEDNGGFHVAALGFASSSGDTFAASSGSTIRQSAIPALTSVAVALADVTQGGISQSILVETKLSASRNWATAGIELRSGAAGGVYIETPGVTATIHISDTMPPWASSTPSLQSPAPVAVQIKGGTVGIAYSESITTTGGTSPFTYSLASGALPAGTALSSGGLISGTPTSVGTYSFTIQSTDSAGHSGTQAFSIIIAAPAAAPNYGYVA